MQIMTRTISTFFFVGLLPKAPGTWGSLIALPLAYLLHLIGGFGLFFAATVLMFFLGWWATSRETAGKDNHDPSEIVIDEVVGQWITLFPVSAALTCSVFGNVCVPFGLVVLAFGLFRLYDIKKPSLVGTADRMNTALGVMLDDVAAGLMAAAALIGLITAVSFFI
jgi:phosphatidylglycerophosphatase A